MTTSIAPSSPINEANIASEPGFFLLKKQRPLIGKVHNIKLDEIPATRIAEAIRKGSSELVNHILQQITAPDSYKPGTPTFLDLVSTDGITKDRIEAIRKTLLRPEKLKAAMRTRFNKLTVHRGDFKWIDGRAYNFNKWRTSQDRALLIILNEMYQLSCLWLIEDGIVLNQDQLSTVFQNVDEFDSFVNRLVAPNETKVSNTPARNAREQRAACLIVRNMLNIFDTMMSEKYQRISDDIQTVLDKLRARAILTPLAEEGAFRLEKKGANGYSVTLKVDTKAFRSIGLKKWSNRKFGNTDLMEDLSRFRCYDTTGNPDNLTRALDDIAKHIFSGKVVIGEKGGLLNHQLIWDRKKLATKSTPLKSATAPTLRHADITGIVQLGNRTTERIEWQFQYEWEMEHWLNHPAIYNLRKTLTASCRKLWSTIDIKNIMFYISRLPLDDIKFSQEEILISLFSPVPSGDLQKIEQSSSLKKWSNTQEDIIETFWSGSVGFLMPLRTKKGGVRFITKDAFVPDLFKIYPEMYTPVPFGEQSMKYISGMVAQIDERQETRMQEYADSNQRYKSMYSQLREQYIPPIQR